MKRTILILIIILELVSINIPPYVELNNLAIIEEIAIKKNNNQYTIILKETIPIKDNQGIDYEYKYYKASATSITKAYKKVSSSTKKKLYLKKAKSLITNITSSKEIITTFDINPSSIIHTNDVISEIKTT